jgi:hypothetical protein
MTRVVPSQGCDGLHVLGQDKPDGIKLVGLVET